MKKNGLILIFILLYSCIAFSQETAEELYNKAMEFKKSNDCNQALVLLGKATTIKPDFGEAWLETGWCQNELSNHSAAVISLEKATILLKNNFRVNYELGHAYYYLDSINPSFKYFRESIRLKSDYPLSYVGVGDLYKDKLNNTTEALNWYLKAYNLDSTHKKTNYWIGWCYNDLEKYTKAVPFLQKVIDAEPTNALAVIELGFSLYSIAKYDESLRVLQTILSVQPKPELALYYAGLCYVRKANKAEAVNKYNELVILNSEYALTLLSEIKKLK